MPRILKGTWRKRESDLFRLCTGQDLGFFFLNFFKIQGYRLWETGPLVTRMAGMWERASGVVVHALVKDEAEPLHETGSRLN